MGLKDKLTQQGSPLSKSNGGNISIPVGATDQSKLHFDYSLNGNPNLKDLPKPSQLDLNGQNPKTALQASDKPQFGTGFTNGTYKNSAPAEGVGNI